FYAIVKHRRCSMQIHVIDFTRGYAGVFHRQSHRTGRFIPAFLQTDSMVRIASRPITDNLGVDLRTALLCPLEILEHIDPGSFAQNHSRSIAREWSRRALRLVVPVSR